MSVLVETVLRLFSAVLRWQDDREDRKRQREQEQARGLSHRAVEQREAQIESATSHKVKP